MTITPFSLGRKLHHDPRSLNFLAPTTSALVTTRHRHYGPVLDQGQVGSCVGNTVADVANTKPLHVPRSRYLTETDAVDIYTQATIDDGFPGQMPQDDTGTSGLAGVKVGVQRGLFTAYDHATGGAEHVALALPNGPFMIGVNWYTSMFEPNSKGFLTISGQVAGGHEFECVGYNKPHDYFTFLNSWSNTWGKGGFFFLSRPDFDRLLHEQGDAIQPKR